MLQSRLHGSLHDVRRRASAAAALATGRLTRADVAVFHALAPPPSGGGNQFLRGLMREFGVLDLRVEQNRLSVRTPACLFNSYNFDFERLRRLARGRPARMVHRVDGPIGVYRGMDEGVDARIAAVNRELADATVFQSRYSLEAHLELGIELVSPVVVHNAADPSIFFPPAAREGRVDRKLRLITTSWSDNPNKGFATYEWLDRNLDLARFEYTFVGRTPVPFKRIRMVEPVPSAELAALLREHDIFVTASRHESCSNAIVEALSCGLPVVYVRSGANAELVRDAGRGFESDEELLDALDEVDVHLDELRTRISVQTLADVAEAYLRVLGLR